MRGPAFLRDVSLLALVCGLIAGSGAPLSRAEEKGGAPKEAILDLGDGVQVPLLTVQPGSFTMGGEGAAPPHPVTLTRAYALGKCEITQAQYEKVMGKNPSERKGAKNPVETVTWDDAVAFCKMASEKTGRKVRLPTEAEWEYACRAGTATTFCFGDDDAVLPDHGWINDNSGSTIRPVGEKKPNAWGFHDMHGNVHEWCADWFADYEEGAATDPTGPPSGEERVMRGGSWGDNAWICRSAARDSRTPDYKIGFIGFRVVVESSAR